MADRIEFALKPLVLQAAVARIFKITTFLGHERKRRLSHFANQTTIDIGMR